MITLNDIFVELLDFPEVMEHFISAKYIGGIPWVCRFLGASRREQDVTYSREMVAGSPLLDCGEIDMVRYPEKFSAGYCMDKKYALDRLFSITLSSAGLEFDDYGYYDSLDVDVCTLAPRFTLTGRDWYDIAEKYMPIDRTNDTKMNILVMNNKKRYEKVPNVSSSCIEGYIATGRIPLFWLKIEHKGIVNLYMADSISAVDDIL